MSSEKAKHSREDAIAQALAEVGERGQALTPFLLARISELTGAASLRANPALLENNARILAEIHKTRARWCKKEGRVCPPIIGEGVPRGEAPNACLTG
ncbi:MAG: hypothetical protein AUK03_07930 [Anaerolineae bacterium CG2_30_64_16]|nr:MAG: hypothetical protein AUK03_07930 [Anaerolineae bacterium CG2_30_64_16]